mmetsp:Transcript_3762/g.4933  ORF Transcript_3762/g.4933 Transcript_3762/m.4933 type:complete len:389 (-) Transcript_3762:169-1335(-)
MRRNMHAKSSMPNPTSRSLKTILFPFLCGATVVLSSLLYSTSLQYQALVKEHEQTLKQQERIQNHEMLVKVEDKATHDNILCDQENKHDAISKTSKTEEPLYEPFNTTNPHQQWCPNVSCQNSPLCAPCNRRYILILATARSASTTLTKMMNFLPNVRLAGENRNFLFIASNLINNFRGGEKGVTTTPLLDQNFDRVDGAFEHNAIPPQAMSCPVQQALNTLNPPPQAIQQNDHIQSIQEYDSNTILGCKTIRFHKNTQEWTLEQATDFLKEAFPCSRIIVNIRSNVTSQLHSIEDTFKNKKQQVKTENEIIKMNQYLIDVANMLGPKMAKVIDMAEWTQNVDILNDVVDWMGFKNCKFHDVVHENQNGFGRDHETDPHLGDKCHYPY